jgi:hypothetical protein
VFVMAVLSLAHGTHSSSNSKSVAHVEKETNYHACLRNAEYRIQHPHASVLVTESQGMLPKKRAPGGVEL